MGLRQGLATASVVLTLIAGAAASQTGTFQHSAAPIVHPQYP